MTIVPGPDGLKIAEDFHAEMIVWRGLAGELAQN
jgi:hypothetical protein